MTPDIVIISPLPDIQQKALELIREQGLANVVAVPGSMSAGLEEARKFVNGGVSVVVTRGGTYRMIAEQLDVAVVEIRITAYDIIAQLKGMDTGGETVGLVGARNVIDEVDLLGDLLPIRFRKIVLESEKDIYEAISKCKAEGIRTFFGDAMAADVAKGLGCRAITITSRKDSINSALQEALRIVQSSEAERKKAQQLITVTDSVREGLVAINDRGEVTIINSRAEQIFKVQREEVMGRPIGQVIPRCQLAELLQNPRDQFGSLLDLGDRKIVISRRAVLLDGKITGAVATLQDVSEMQKVEQKVRRSLTGRGFDARYHFADIIQAGPAMGKCLDSAREFARFDANVLLLGDSGTGKEMICQSIHNESRRAAGPFVAINCAAIPNSLIEAEFFGYEEGAFTGANRNGRPGVFELAHNGTVFLDEIGELPLKLQGRLLRVLQEKEIMRLGGTRVVPVDLRVICATNRNLEEMARAGKFRKDLLYRINVLGLRIPSLGERGPECLLKLAENFIASFSAKYNKPLLRLEGEFKRALLQKRYEGNIRELANILERCVILSSAEPLFQSLESDRLAETEPAGALESGASSQTASPTVSPTISLAELEKSHIRRVQRENGGHLGRSAKALGIDRSTLWRKLKALDGQD